MKELALAVAEETTAPNFYHIVGTTRMGVNATQTVNQDTYAWTLYYPNSIYNIITAVSVNNTQRVVFTEASMQLRISNPSNVTVFLNVYYVKPRHMISTAAFEPDTAFENYFTQQGGTADTDLITGVSPYQSTAFTRHFKIYHTKKFKLIPAGSTTLWIKDRRRHLITGQDWLNNTATAFTFSKSIMITAMGMPVNASATPSNIHPATFGLDIIDVVKYTYHQVNDSTSLITTVNNQEVIVNPVTQVYGAPTTTGQVPTAL